MLNRCSRLKYCRRTETGTDDPIWWTQSTLVILRAFWYVFIVSRRWSLKTLVMSIHTHSLTQTRTVNAVTAGHSSLMFTENWQIISIKCDNCQFGQFHVSELHSQVLLVQYTVTPQEIERAEHDPLLDLLSSALWPSAIFVWSVCARPHVPWHTRTPGLKINTQAGCSKAKVTLRHLNILNEVTLRTRGAEPLKVSWYPGSNKDVVCGWLHVRTCVSNYLLRFWLEEIQDDTFSTLKTET